MDWKKTGYAWDVAVNVVHQTDVNKVIGSLSGVLPDSIQVSENYYSDSRIQAKVATVVKEGTSDGYINHGRLRILFMVPDRNFAEEFITGYVSDINENTEHGYTKRTYTIESTIWGLLEHKISASVTIAKGAKLLTVWTGLVSKQTKMQYSTAGAQDYTYGSTIIYEAGTNLSTMFFEMNESINRFGVDGHGRLTLREYVAPSKQTPAYTLEYKDLRGLMLSPLSRSMAQDEAPGRAIVTATVTKEDSNGKSTQQTLVGAYDAPNTHDTSIQVRGWLKARSDAYSGASDNPNQTELNAVAKKNWENAQKDIGAEWSANTVFGDYHAGDVCLLIPHENAAGVKVLVKATTINLSSMSQDLTLKEV